MQKVLIKNDVVEINLYKSLKKAKKVSKKLDHKINKETLVLINIAKKQTEVEKAIENCKKRIAEHHEAAVDFAKVYDDSMARNYLDLQHSEEGNLKRLERSLDVLKTKYRNGVEIIRKLNVSFDKVITDIKRYESEIANNEYVCKISKTKPVFVKKHIDDSTRVPELTKEIPESKYLTQEAIKRVKKDLETIKKVDKKFEDKEVAALRG